MAGWCLWAAEDVFAVVRRHAPALSTVLRRGRGTLGSGFLTGLLGAGGGVQCRLSCD